MLKPLFTYCLFIVANGLFAQPIQPAFRNFTTEEGLPSSEVYDILQDSMGYMWFATDNGVSRFDGYTFKNYGLKEGLPDPVVFNLQEAPTGRIWMSTLSKRMYYLEDEIIYPYPFNSSIAAIDSLFYVIGQFDVDFRNRSLTFVAKNDLGILTIDSVGNIQQKEQYAGTHFGAQEVNGQLLYYTYNRHLNGTVYNQEMGYKKKGKMLPIWLSTTSEVLITDLTYPPSPRTLHAKAFALANETYWLTTNLRQYIIKNGKLAHYWDDGLKVNTIVELPNGGWLVGCLNNQGVYYFPSKQLPTETSSIQFLNDFSITDIFLDRTDGLWISTLEQGIFYAPDYRFRVYNEKNGIGSNVVSSVAAIDTERVWLSTWAGEFGQLSNATAQYQMQKHLNIPLYDLAYDPGYNTLWIVSNYNSFRWVENQLQELYYLPPTTIKKRQLFAGKRVELGTSAMIAGGNFFTTLKRSSNRTTYISIQKENKKKYKQRCFAIFEDSQQQIWLSNSNGFFQFAADSLVDYSDYHPAFKKRIDDIEELPDGTLVLGTKGSGIVFWKADKFKTLTTADRLVDNAIERLHVDESGALWVGTLQGMNKITFNNGEPQIQPVTKQHGLPSNEIWDIDSYGEHIWVATAKGLVNFTNSPLNTYVEPPLISGLRVNGKDTLLVEGLALPFSVNTLTFKVLSLNYRTAEETKFRYRLQETTEWQQISQAEIRFPALAPDDYRFEIQAQNEDNIWSKSVFYNFSIQPPWYQRWWFFTVILLFLAGIIFIFFKQRSDRLREKYRVQQELQQIENAAVRAQMNPHFIFNCLNSIQKFIAAGEADDAMRYLAKFAQLIRQVLKASQNEEVALGEEISLLRNYVALEQLRMNHRFDFIIDLPPDLDIYETTVPPLIFQPFVENAIIHGFTSLTQKGLIEMKFSMEYPFLLITLQDNGVGLWKKDKSASLKKESLHQSIGLTLVERRLQILNGQSTNFTLQHLTQTDGQPKGTLVKIRIRQKN